jgi:hypothetical protein
MSKRFGVVRNEFLQGANAIGSIAKASGLATNEAADMGVKFTKLAADLSSFKNIRFDEALRDIQSGLVGEAEPLRRHGVLLSEAAVQAEAAALGLGKASGASDKLARAQRGVERAQLRVNEALRKHGRNSAEFQAASLALADAQAKVEDAGQGANVQLTEQEKVQARASLIAKQLADASGDLGRTQNSLANVLRATRGHFVDLFTDVGQRFLPTATNLAITVRDKLIPALGVGLTGAVDRLAPLVNNELVPAIGRFADRLPQLIQDGLPRLEGLVRDSVPLMKTLAGAVSNLTDLLGPSGLAASTFAIKLGVASGSAEGLSIGLGVGLGVALHNLVETHFPEVNRALEAFGGWLYDAGKKLNEWLLPALRELRDLIEFFSGQGGEGGPGWLDRLVSNLGQHDWGFDWLPGVGDPHEIPGLPSFGSGGPVPGPVGMPVLAVVHGGETVSPFGGDGASAQPLYLEDGTRLGRAVSRQQLRRQRARR